MCASWVTLSVLAHSRHFIKNDSDGEQRERSLGDIQQLRKFSHRMQGNQIPLDGLEPLQLGTFVFEESQNDSIQR